MPPSPRCFSTRRLRLPGYVETVELLSVRGKGSYKAPRGFEHPLQRRHHRKSQSSFGDIERYRRGRRKKGGRRKLLQRSRQPPFQRRGRQRSHDTNEQDDHNEALRGSPTEGKRKKVGGKRKEIWEMEGARGNPGKRNSTSIHHPITAQSTCSPHQTNSQSNATHHPGTCKTPSPDNTIHHSDRHPIGNQELNVDSQ